jgi:hypothetical protein
MSWGGLDEGFSVANAEAGKTGFDLDWEERERAEKGEEDAGVEGTEKGTKCVLRV